MEFINSCLYLGINNFNIYKFMNLFSKFYYSTHLFGNNKKIDPNKNFDSYEIWKHQLKLNKFNSLFNKI